MKKKILSLLLLLFALLMTVYFVHRLSKKNGQGPGDASETGTALVPGTETLEEKTFPYETAENGTSGEAASEYGPGGETEPPAETEYDPGEPVDRENIPADLMFVSDVHYMSSSLTDYGAAFDGLVDDGDGKVVQYMPQIWQAFSDEVLRRRPDVLILSGDLTLDGEKVNHQELAAHLKELEAAGIPVLVIPGNHDINNPDASAYFGNEKSSIETVTPEEFREIYDAFGYGEAVSYAPDSLSYLYRLNETTWLLMLDTCIYEPENRVSGEIREGTLAWAEQCMQSAYSQGITVLPVGHHNLQEISRVYVDECVIENHVEALRTFERYLTQVYFSGHLHAQRIMKHISEPGVGSEVYGIWEVVSNSLIIPPCQYGNLSIHADGSMSYHTENVDVSGWAAKHGETNPDLLDFDAFSDTYLRTVISHQTYRSFDDIPDEIREVLADFYADLYRDYYAGRQINYSERKKEWGYSLWDRFMNPSIQFRQVEGMLRDGMVVNNRAEIPDPIGLERK